MPARPFRRPPPRRGPSPRPPACGWATRFGDETLSKTRAFIRREGARAQAITAPKRLALEVCEP